MKPIVISLALVLSFGHTSYAAEVEGVTTLPDYWNLGSTDSTVTESAPAPEVTSPAEDTSSGKKKHLKKARKPNFGALVSAEAHRLKAEGLNGQHKMGPWVRDQRSQKSIQQQVAGNSPATRGGGAAKSSRVPANSHKK